MKKIKFIVCLIFGMQISLVYSAQESKIDTDLDRQGIINQAVIDFPHLVEGLNLIRENYIPVVVRFQDFLENNLAPYDEDFNFSEITTDATDLIFKNVKEPFLKNIKKVINENIQLDLMRDPIFLYVMKYRDGFIQFHVKELINKKNNLGDTLLHNAVWAKSLSIVKTLINSGVDLNPQDKFGLTPLHAAIQRNHFEEPEYIMEMKVADYNKQDAVKRNRIEVVCMLIAAGADVNIQNRGGNTPLHFAAMENDVEIAGMLIDAGADLNSKNNVGWSPLYKAVRKNNAKVVRVLIEAGADITIQDSSGRTAKQLASTHEMRHVFNQASMRKGSACTIS